MHHGADADGSGICQYHVIFFFDCLLETAVAALQSLMDLCEGISPDAVLQRVLPVVYTDGQHLAFPVDENRFDTGGTEFNAQGRLAVNDHLLIIQCCSSK